MKSEEGKTIFYNGFSMFPYFRNLDKLVYVPYGKRMIKPGDIVVIDAPNGRKVIHRVLSTHDDKIITMGDCCRSPDSWILAPDQIAGLVIYAFRGKRRLHIKGGLHGRLYAIPIRLAYRLFGLLFDAYKTICNLLEKSGALNILPINLKVFAFERPDGTELQLLMGKYIVGRRRPGSKWHIMPPFAFFLKENALDHFTEKEG